MREIVLATLAVAVVSTSLTVSAPLQAQGAVLEESAYSVIPRPTSLTPRAGVFRLTGQTTFIADSAFAAVTRRFARDLAAPTGYSLPVRVTTTATARTSPAPSAIRIIRETAAGAAQGAESYRLEVTPAAVTIHATGEAGVFYALQTIRQLLPANVFRSAPIAGTEWTIPAVSIVDAPRFTWRGMHLDVSRHFMPKEFVKKYIDLLAMHKINTFHWHLTEDQGWRIEIKQYPKLTSVGSCRDQTMVGAYQSDPAKRVFDGKKHCGFYTQDDIREIVAYAADRFVTVVPEIEMPGHVQAAIAAYPELGVRQDTTVGVMQIWGVSQFILNAEPATVTFMQNVLSEVLELFPSKFIHIGGDEADTSCRAGSFARWMTS